MCAHACVCGGDQIHLLGRAANTAADTRTRDKDSLERTPNAHNRASVPQAPSDYRHCSRGLDMCGPEEKFRDSTDGVNMCGRLAARKWVTIRDLNFPYRLT